MRAVRTLSILATLAGWALGAAPAGAINGTGYNCSWCRPSNSPPPSTPPPPAPPEYESCGEFTFEEFRAWAIRQKNVGGCTYARVAVLHMMWLKRPFWDGYHCTSYTDGLDFVWNCKSNPYNPKDPKWFAFKITWSGGKISTLKGSLSSANDGASAFARPASLWSAVADPLAVLDSAPEIPS